MLAPLAAVLVQEAAGASDANSPELLREERELSEHLTLFLSTCLREDFEILVAAPKSPEEAAAAASTAEALKARFLADCNGGRALVEFVKSKGSWLEGRLRGGEGAAAGFASERALRLSVWEAVQALLVLALRSGPEQMHAPSAVSALQGWTALTRSLCISKAAGAADRVSSSQRSEETPFMAAEQRRPLEALTAFQTLFGKIANENLEAETRLRLSSNATASGASHSEEVDSHWAALRSEQRRRVAQSGVEERALQELSQVVPVETLAWASSRFFLSLRLQDAQHLKARPPPRESAASFRRGESASRPETQTCETHLLCGCAGGRRSAGLLEANFLRPRRTRHCAETSSRDCSRRRGLLGLFPAHSTLHATGLGVASSRTRRRPLRRRGLEPRHSTVRGKGGRRLGADSNFLRQMRDKASEESKDVSVAGARENGDSFVARPRQAMGRSWKRRWALLSCASKTALLFFPRSFMSSRDSAARLAMAEWEGTTEASRCRNPKSAANDADL